jgi:hypothetical protein
MELYTEYIGKISLLLLAVIFWIFVACLIQDTRKFLNEIKEKKEKEKKEAIESVNYDLTCALGLELLFSTPIAIAMAVDIERGGLRCLSSYGLLLIVSIVLCLVITRLLRWWVWKNANGKS